MDDVDGFYSIDQLLLAEENHADIEDEVEFEDDFVVQFDASSLPQFHEEENSQQQPVDMRKKPEMTLEKRRLVVQSLLSSLKGDSLGRGDITKIAEQHGVSKSTISRMFKDVKQQRNEGGVIDVRTKKLGRVGKKPGHYPEAWLQSVPLRLRTTTRSFAGALKVSHQLVWKLKQRGFLRSHISSNHPTVSDKHKLARMKWVLSHIIPQTPWSPAVFDPMASVIHIDEKWFYLNPEKRKFYLLPKEDDPYRCTQSKRFRIKVMFMAVIGRPLYDGEGNMIHEGKYGVFPFAFRAKAKKSSKNRAAGTWETKAMQNVTQQVIRNMLINNVIPCIMRNWPQQLPKEVKIQQDNARPHISAQDPEFLAAANQNGFTFELVNQPAQSPDLNVLDLGLFRSIQSIQHQAFPKTIDELVENVYAAYESFDPIVNRNIWLTLQFVMVAVLETKGGNGFKLGHANKAKMEKEGKLPDNLTVDQGVIDEAVAYLNERLVQVEDWEEHIEEEEEIQQQEEPDQE